MLNAIGIPVVNASREVHERNDALVKAAFLYGVPVYADTDRQYHY